MRLTISSGALMPSLAQVSVTHPTPPATVALTGTGDTDLAPSAFAAAYVKVLNVYTQVYLTGSKLAVTSSGLLEVLRPCSVHIDGYLDVTHSANNSTVGATFFVERGPATVFSPRAVHSKMPNSGDIGHLSGNGFSELLPGDLFGLALATDVTGTVSVRSSSLTFTAY